MYTTVRPTRSAISTRGETIHTVTLRSAVPVESDKEPLVAVVGNGAFGGPQTFGRVMRRFVETATEDGVDATVVMYRDKLPWYGNYSDDARTKRVAHIVGDTAIRTERPVHLIGHSWSWPGVLEVAEGTPELVAALEGYTPTGHQECKAGGAKWHNLFVSAADEALHTNIFRGFGSGVAIASNMALRFPTPTARSEAISSFNSDVTDRVMGLTGRIPVGFLYGEKDAFFHPSATALATLEEADVVMHAIPKTHLGAVLDYRLGTDLYNLAVELENNR